MIAPAISGPAEAMNIMLASTIIHTTIGMSHIFIPGARLFIVVTVKLMPPSRNATNSSATAISQSVGSKRRQVIRAVGGKRRIRSPGASERAALHKK